MSGQHEVEATATQPRLTLETSQIFCPWHGPIFKYKWPLAYPTFAVDGLQRLLASEEFQSEVNHDSDKVNVALHRRPICCRLSRDTILDILRGVSEFTKVAKCSGCGFQLDCVSYDKLNVYGRTVGQSLNYCLSCCCAYAEETRAIYDRKFGVK